MSELTIAEVVARLDEMDEAFREMQSAWCKVRDQVDEESQNDVGIPMQTLEMRLVGLRLELDPQGFEDDDD